jgi:hypothetical protein
MIVKAMKNIKQIIIITLLSIIVLGYLCSFGEVYSYIQSALILFLLVICLPLTIYQYNTKKRKKITHDKHIR